MLWRPAVCKEVPAEASSSTLDGKIFLNKYDSKSNYYAVHRLVDNAHLCTACYSAF